MKELLASLYNKNEISLSHYLDWYNSQSYTVIDSTAQIGTGNKTIKVLTFDETGGMYGSPHLNYYNNGANIARIIQHAAPDYATYRALVDNSIPIILTNIHSGSVTTRVSVTRNNYTSLGGVNSYSESCNSFIYYNFNTRRAMKRNPWTNSEQVLVI